jgi:hypothetical protein
VKTRKDFETRASLIKGLKTPKQRATATREAIAEFTKDNPRFDKARFVAMCKGKLTPIKKPFTVPGITYYHKIVVNTDEWGKGFEALTQFEELYSVTYKGVTYTLKECQNERLYPKNHAWAGQVESRDLDLRHVFHRFVGHPPRMNCGEPSWDCELKDFISDFLFQVEGAEDIESCTAYQCYMEYIVEEKELPKFQRSLQEIYNVLSQCRFEFEKDHREE